MTTITNNYISERRSWIYWFALLILIVAAISLRLWLALRANDIIDVHNFQRVAQTINSQGIFALYSQTPGQYPYPPLWIWFALVAEHLDQRSVIDFSLAIRLPSITADAICIYVVWAWWRNSSQIYSWLASLLYAVNPISLIITSLHGQFDALPTLFVVIAFYTFRQRQINFSALALGLAIATKSFPVLLLPVFLIVLPSRHLKIRYTILAMLPVALLLLPFVIRIPFAVLEQLFGYSGVGLLGFLVPIRSVYVAYIGDHLPYELTQKLISLSKWFFLAAYATWILFAARRRASLIVVATGILCLFYLLYGGVSPQYLLWIVPLLLILPVRSLFSTFIYTVSGSLALVGFYSYAVSDTIQPIFPLDLLDSRLMYGGGGILWWVVVGLLFVLLANNLTRLQWIYKEKVQ